MKKIFCLVALSLLIFLCTFAFSSCIDNNKGTPSLEFSAIDDNSYGVKIGNDKSLSEIVIPKNHNGKPVTKILDYAFSDCKNLTSISIPDTITHVGTYAFNGCSSLTSLVLPSSVRVIDSFGYCKALESIEFPDNISKIGEYALGSSVLPSLKYTEYDNCKYLGNEKNPYLILFRCSFLSARTINVHKDTKIIYSNAFSGAYVKDLTIPEGVEQIGSFAFSSCSNLKNLSIPSSISLIEDSAFYSCPSSLFTEHQGGYYVGNEYNPYLVLVRAKFTDITEFEINPNTKIICNSAFENCAMLASIVIPDSVYYVGHSAFRNCASLTSVTLSKNLTGIKEYTFYNCSLLTNVDIPQSVCDIGVSAFENCSTITSFTFPKNVTRVESSVLKNCTALTTVDVQGAVYSIGESAFYDCSQLSSLSIPNSINFLGNDALYNCEALRFYEFMNAYYLGNPDTPFTILMKATSKDIVACLMSPSTRIIYDSAFEECSSLNNVYIPKNVTQIGKRAFYNCSSITNEIVLPDRLTTIKEETFYGCNFVPSFTIPNGVRTIEKWAFFECWAVKSIVLPDSLISIGSHSFNDCRALTSVVMGPNVAYIGDYAFIACSSRLVIHCKAIEQQNNWHWDSDWNVLECQYLSRCTIKFGYKDE